MKTSHKESRATEVEIVDDETCHKCGKSCKLADERFGDKPILGGLIGAFVHGSYFSDHGLFDCNEYRFSICELCLVEMFDTFAIPPEIFCRIDSEKVTLEQHRSDRAAREEHRRPKEDGNGST